METFYSILSQSFHNTVNFRENFVNTDESYFADSLAVRNIPHVIKKLEWIKNTEQVYKQMCGI